MWLLLLVSIWCLQKTADTQEVNNSTNEENALIEAENNCSCVMYYLCDKDGFINKNGEGLVNIRLGDEQGVIGCGGGKFENEFVCCKHRPEDNLENGSSNENDTTVTSEKPTISRCGKQLPNINIRIFADEEELNPINGEFPWIAPIYKFNKGLEKWVFHGSGSLIHARVILTANHVIKRYKAEDLKVVVNGQIELPVIGNKPEEERNVKKIIKNKSYSSGTLANDVALLILDNDYNVSAKSSVNTICLRPEESFDNKKCIVAGWGTGPTMDGIAKVLKKVEVPIVSNSKCEELLQKTRLGPRFKLHESFMCAGGEEGRDACKGDGGSPLMCPGNGGQYMYQVGIVAWGIGCGKKDVPGVYANVGQLHSWIVEKLEEEGITL